MSTDSPQELPACPACGQIKGFHLAACKLGIALRLLREANRAGETGIVFAENAELELYYDVPERIRQRMNEMWERIESLRSEIGAQTNAAALVSEDRKLIGRSEGDNTSNEKLVAAAPSVERTQCRLCEADTTNGNDHNCSGLSSASAAPSDDRIAHTDHPLRHWDRTCPACNPTDDKSETPRTDAYEKEVPVVGTLDQAHRAWGELCRMLERELNAARSATGAILRFDTFGGTICPHCGKAEHGDCDVVLRISDSGSDNG